MKKNIFLSVVASLLMVSCTSDNDFEQKEPISSDIRSLNEALKIAQESLDILNEEYETRGIPQIRSINPKKCKIVRSGSTRSSEGANDTLMYVFNFDDEQGFAIVSAPKNAEDLLAITEIGSFEPDIQTGIEGFDEFILKAKEYCQKKQNTVDDTDVSIGTTRSPISGVEEFMDSTWYLVTHIVPPAVSVRWGQTHPEGEFCPNGISGCTNTAMAQIMSCFQYPDTICLTYPDADKSYEVLNWTNIKVHTTNHNLNNCTDTNTHTSIARLLRQLGFLNFSEYNANSTSTDTESYASNTFSYLGYTVGCWDDYNVMTACDSMDASHPLLMIGRTANNSGHAWVLDGYKIIRKYVQRMRRINGSNWFPIGSPSSTSKRYMHYNWGWYGNCNGYFLSVVFDTSDAYQYDTNNNTASYDFQYNVRMLSVYR